MFPIYYAVSASLIAIYWALISGPTVENLDVNYSTPVERYSQETKVISRRYNWELDTASMLAKSNFAIRPSKLIERCKQVIDNGIG